MGLGTGPAWAVVSLVTMVVLFYTLAPAHAAELQRVSLGPGPDMIDAPMVEVNGKVVTVDGTEVKLSAWNPHAVTPMDPLQTRLREWRERIATYGLAQPPSPAIVYRLAPDTPAAALQSVDDAARAEGFTEPYFLR